MRFATLFAITSSAEFLADTDMTEEQAIGVGRTRLC
jgi:hypothetical protein